jgi:amidohydrolase
MLIDQIKEQATSIYDTVLQYRRHLHAHPELSFQEFKTSAFVKERLDHLGIPWQSVAETGVVAFIKGEGSFSNKEVMLRADMDALPIQEANQVDYVSRNGSVMHACGHDAHMASLLGVAHILQAIKNRFSGTVKLVFQPAEEKLPGGAVCLIKEGILNTKPLAVIGQHVSPSVDAGKIAIRSGKFMASMDEIFVTVSGKGGHGAQPHQNIDPVMISAQILVALQQIVSRMANPVLPTVLSFGKVIAEGAINVIPDQVYMEGTFRTLDEGWRSEAHIRMKKIAESIAESMGGHCDFTIVRGYPVLYNEENLTGEVQTLAREYLGSENVIEPDIWMAAEDFARYSQLADSCFYLLGVRNEGKGIVSSLHTSTFNIDESALILSTGLMAYIAVKKLGN